MYLFINKDTACTARKISNYLIKFLWLVHLYTKHSLHCQINLKHTTCFITSYLKKKKNYPRYQTTNNNEKASQISHCQRFLLRKKHLQLTMIVSMHLFDSTKVKAQLSLLQFLFQD